MDNFIMDVQGSGYIDFGDGSPLNFFSYSGKNGHAYRSIGKVLIDRGEVKKEDMSMQAIREWGENTAKPKCASCWSRTRRSSSLNRKLRAGERGQRGTADWPRVGGIGSFDYSCGHHAAG
jgi:membrane-bound lytic murein transglycosylase A